MGESEQAVPARGTAVVILGASGDLARRKLIPALDRLWRKGCIDDSSIIVGSGRTEFTDEAFRARFDVSAEFARLLSWHTGIPGLQGHIRSRGDFRRIVVFMALPPDTYGVTAARLAAEGFGEETSIIVEKPFGRNTESAVELDRTLSRHFDESRIYRIDHYLGKEAVQNILVFRFANAIFQPMWNSTCISSIQINALEEIGVEERGPYFDHSGIMRDMVQNHLMQLLCLLTMEPPVTLDAADIRARKVDVLRAMGIEECHRQQYEGYHAEKGVAPGSATETYAELRLHINNQRWSGTPVFIRTGKATGRRGTEIGITLKPLPPTLFNGRGTLTPNKIIFKIQPGEGIIVDLCSKAPGTDSSLARTHMNFCYRHSFAGEIPEAYQRLLLDVFKEDHTLFVSAEETEMSWRLLGPYLDHGDVGHYKKGEIPVGKLDVEWIDFSQYADICA